MAATDPPGARAAVDEAIELLEPLGPSIGLADALYNSSYGYMLARQAGPATTHGRRALSIAEELGASDLVLRLRLQMGTIDIVLGEVERAIARLRAVRNDALNTGDHRTESIALGMLGSGGGESRHYATAIEALEEGIELGLRTDHDYSVAYDRAWLARIAFEQGRWDDAVEYAELVDATSVHRTGVAMVTAQGALGRVRVRRGDPGGRAILERIVAEGANHELQHIWSPVCGIAEHTWLTGGTDAPDVLRDAYRRALDTDSAWARGEIGFWMWRLGAIDAAPEGAAEPFALQIAGDWRRAAASWEELGCPYEAALALADGDDEACHRAVAAFDGARCASRRPDRSRSPARPGRRSHPPGTDQGNESESSCVCPKALDERAVDLVFRHPGKMSVDRFRVDGTKHVRRAAVLVMKGRREKLVIVEFRQIRPQVDGARSGLESPSFLIVVKSEFGPVPFGAKPALVTGDDAPVQAIEAR